MVLGPFAGVLVDPLEPPGGDDQVGCAGRPGGAGGGAASAAGALALAHLCRDAGALARRRLSLAAMQASTSLMVPDEHLSRVAGFIPDAAGGDEHRRPGRRGAPGRPLPLHGCWPSIARPSWPSCPSPWWPSRGRLARPRRVRASLSLATCCRPALHVELAGALLVGGLAVAINMVLSPAFALMPILVTRHFRGDVLQFGAMESTWGVGIVLAG